MYILKRKKPYTQSISHNYFWNIFQMKHMIYLHRDTITLKFYYLLANEGIKIIHFIWCPRKQDFFLQHSSWTLLVDFKLYFCHSPFRKLRKQTYQQRKMFENNDKVLGFPKILPLLFWNTKLLESFLGGILGNQLFWGCICEKESRLSMSMAYGVMQIKRDGFEDAWNALETEPERQRYRNRERQRQETENSKMA